MGNVLRRFAILVVLPGLILLGFGLRTVEQDRRATEQQVRDRVRHAAEMAARAIDQHLANWQQFRSLAPPRRVAYLPNQRLSAQPPEPALAEAELVQRRYDSAIVAKTAYLDELIRFAQR